MFNIFNYIINKLLTIVPKFIIRIFANKYIAGTSINESLKVVEKINKLNLSVTLDILGEHTSNQNESIRITNEYKYLLKQINLLEI